MVPLPAAPCGLSLESMHTDSATQLHDAFPVPPLSDQPQVRVEDSHVENGEECSFENGEERALENEESKDSGYSGNGECHDPLGVSSD